jgi:hypothetical protein
MVTTPGTSESGRSIVGSEQHLEYTPYLRGVWPQRWIWAVARRSSSELLKGTTSRARKARRLLLRCQPCASERLITWPWNDPIQARSACCSLEAPYHLPLHLSPSDGLHIEAALASANAKVVACRRYIMYQLLRGVRVNEKNVRIVGTTAIRG